MNHDSTPPPPMPGYTPPPGPGYYPQPPQPSPAPKKTATVLIAAGAAVVAAVLAAVVTASVTGDGEAEAAPTVTVTKTVPAETGDTAADEESAAPTEESGDDSYGFGDTIAYDNDVEISLTKITRAVSSEYASPERTPYAKFTIKIVNKSDKKVDASMMTVNCAYGDEGKEGEAIYDDGLDGLPDTSILAGRSLTVPWGCELPKGESFLQIEVAPDYESETAIFAGQVK
ncbi:hypothetical protein DI272_03585 [Streptomyces sp. Act143]|uniref:hypothetical protein n=1 Tax=Streptomyces sp. Act143 TaxID=2200760 RepID=UPI000D67F879|nr:hypothetical protein [Streptomyces sp. Act143]PWI13314.1 hypothetical protein DI272_03585 [Streptomyces sp. Act143]